MDIDIYNASIAIASFLIGFITSFFIKEAWQERRIKRLENANEALESALLSLQNRERGLKGLEVKKEKAERMQAALGEFVIAMQQPNANMGEVIKALGTRYPDLALDLLKKGKI